MAFNYNKAHRRSIVQAVKTRGGTFGALYDVCRWNHLTPADSVKLADEVGIALNAEQVQELRERWEEAEAADALATGREPRVAEALPVRWESAVPAPGEYHGEEWVVVDPPSMTFIGMDGMPGHLVVTKGKAVAVAIDGTETPFEFPPKPTPPAIKRMDFNRKKT